MTTPIPTRELLEGLLAFVRKQAIALNDDGTRYINRVVNEQCCGTCWRPISSCDRNNARDPDRDCQGQPARAALAAWERRPRLRDDLALRAAVESGLTDGTSELQDWKLQERAQARRERQINAILDAIDAALGTGPRGAERETSG